MPSETVLVAGANGRLGKAVVARLRERGHSVRSGVRDPSKLVPVASETRVALDLRRPETFAPALDGVHRVITCVQGMTARARRSIESIDIEGHKRLIDAAAAAGISRFVYTSALGADADHPAPLLRAKVEVERHLAASKLDYVILRPSAFMELYAHDLIGARVLAGKPVWLLGKGNTRRNLVSVADVAAIAVLALEEERCSDCTIEIGGPDNLTDREIADLYGRFAGRPVRTRSIPSPMVRALATAFAPIHSGASNLLRFFLTMEDAGDIHFDASGMTALLGRPPTDLASHSRSRA